MSDQVKEIDQSTETAQNQRPVEGKGKGRAIDEEELEADDDDDESGDEEVEGEDADVTYDDELEEEEDDMAEIDTSNIVSGKRDRERTDYTKEAEEQKNELMEDEEDDTDFVLKE